MVYLHSTSAGEGTGREQERECTACSLIQKIHVTVLCEVLRRRGVSESLEYIHQEVRAVKSEGTGECDEGEAAPRGQRSARSSSLL